jgi:hypothetical protein
MKLIEFPEQTVVIAKHQPQYNPMPAWRREDDVEGLIVCCWRLTWRERIKLLFTGKLWHSILTFKQAIQPCRLQVKYPFKKQ